MNLAGKRVLVTGAGGGIGGALVRRLIASGADVLLSGRNAEAMQKILARLDVSDRRALCVMADLTQPADRSHLCEIARTWHGGIDMLINNAGVGAFGMLADQSTESIGSAIDTNLIAPMELCRELLPHLQTRPLAHIVNIGSVLGSRPGGQQYLLCHEVRTAWLQRSAAP